MDGRVSFWPGKKLINNSTILRVSNDAKTSAKTKSMSKLLKQNDHDIKNKNIFSFYLKIDYKLLGAVHKRRRQLGGGQNLIKIANV